MPTEIEKAYVAGFLDGEGHIGITVAKLRPNGGWRTHVLIVTLANTDLEVLRWAQTLWPGGSLVVRKQPCQRVPIGNLRWTSAAAALVLRELQPYLRVKATQAKIGLDFVLGVNAQGSHSKVITEEQWERREGLRIAIRLQNRPGQQLDKLPFPVQRFERQCLRCGQPFVSISTSKRTYCSTVCQRKARWQRIKQTLTQG